MRIHVLLQYITVSLVHQAVSQASRGEPFYIGRADRIVSTDVDLQRVSENVAKTWFVCLTLVGVCGWFVSAFPVSHRHTHGAWQPIEIVQYTLI